jgi:hypothetical protein
MKVVKLGLAIELLVALVILIILALVNLPGIIRHIYQRLRRGDLFYWYWLAIVVAIIAVVAYYGLYE